MFNKSYLTNSLISLKDFYLNLSASLVSYKSDNSNENPHFYKKLIHNHVTAPINIHILSKPKSS